MKKYPKNYSMATINSDQGLTSICTQGSTGPVERYVLYDPNQGVPPMYYKDLLNQAKESIRIMDPYAFENDAISVFEAVCHENIFLEIFTQRYTNREIVAIADEINNILMKNISNYTINILSYKQKHDVQPKEQRMNLWHDRYLIIDDKDFYLVGSSTDEHVTSQVFHGICQLTVDADKRKVCDLFEFYRRSYRSSRAYKTIKTGR